MSLVMRVGQFHDAFGHLAPRVSAQGGCESLECRAHGLAFTQPVGNSLSQLGVIFRITLQEERQCRRIPLSHACGPGNDCRYSTAQCLVHCQSIGFVTSRTNEQIGSTDEPWNVVYVAK